MTKRTKKNEDVAVIETAVVEAPATEDKAPTKRQLFRSQTVRLVRDDNPKKKGSMSYDRFQDYFGLDKETPPTVDWVLRNTNIRMDDIRHDSAHGFIQLGDAPVPGRQATAADFGIK